MKTRIFVIAGATLIANMAVVHASESQSATGQSGNSFDRIKAQAKDQAIRMASRAYERIKKEGAPYAEKLLRATPNYYKGIQTRLSEFLTEVTDMPTVKQLDQKRTLILQLWQMRAAVDVMGLTDPLIVSNLTGLKIDDVARMKSQLSTVTERLRKLNVV